MNSAAGNGVAGQRLRPSSFFAHTVGCQAHGPQTGADRLEIALKDPMIQFSQGGIVDCNPLPPTRPL
jgi:hypothetical protein